MLDLNNSKNNSTNQELIRQGAETDFWKLLVQALEESKENIIKARDKDISDLPAEQYKFVSEISKEKEALIDYLIELPEATISWLENSDTKIEDFDPYS